MMRTVRKMFRKLSKQEMPKLSKDELRNLPYTVDPDESIAEVREYKKAMEDAKELEANGGEKEAVEYHKSLARNILISLSAKDSIGGKFLKIIISGRARCGDCKHSMGYHELVHDPVPTALTGPCGKCSCESARYMSN